MLPCGVALVFRVLPAPRLSPEGPEGDRGSFPANAGVWQPHLEPRARALFSNHHQAAGKQPRLSRSSSMGPWPSYGSNGMPWRGLDTEARVFRSIFAEVL